MAANTLREELVDAICEAVRILFPRLRVDDYFKMRRRLQETGLSILVEILEFMTDARTDGFSQGSLLMFLSVCDGMTLDELAEWRRARLTSREEAARR